MDQFLQEIKGFVSSSDVVLMSVQKPGGSRAETWHRSQTFVPL